MQANDQNTFYLFKTNFKQNLIKNLVWILVLVGLFAAVASKFNVLFGSKGDINAIITTLKTPAMVSIFGEFSAVKPYTTANVFASEMLIFMGMFVVFMNIFIAVHDTRAQEESGLTEMVRSRQVGRRAPLEASAIEILAMNIFLGVLFVLSLSLADLKGATFQGNILTGVILASVGILFGAITLLAAQLTNSSRGANFLAYGIFAAFYIVRMLTDVTNPDFTWLSPFGWISKTKIYTDDNWLPVLLMLVLAAIAYFAAVKISNTRDIDSGVLTVRAGKEKAGRFLSSPLGLVLKLERNSIFGWVIGMFIFGVTYGSIFSTVGDIIGTNPTYKKLLGVTQIKEANMDLLLSFVNMLAVFFVAVAVISGLMVLFRLKSDEKKGYLEVVHAKKVSRFNIALSYYGVSLFLGIVSLVVSFAGTFLVGNSTLDDPIPMKYFWQTLGANIPAVVFFISVAFFIVSIAPKLTSLVWAYLGAGFLLRMFGSLLDLSDNVNMFSPFGWVGKVPQESLEVKWVVIMLVAFCVLSVLGLVGYRKRDL